MISKWKKQVVKLHDTRIRATALFTRARFQHFPRLDHRNVARNDCKNLISLFLMTASRFVRLRIAKLGRTVSLWVWNICSGKAQTPRKHKSHSESMTFLGMSMSAVVVHKQGEWSEKCTGNCFSQENSVVELL
eukprot:TRINITY_DN414_c0_g1_i1.p1 TRINITY_DN414_c0_g1~~TRINITY_DN414_c0_g1_i1.p1  ORF type:complete len:133 (+),score=16.30 TRINITY_DN414_c0_g1_i1:747-1145(+)